jgi:hypothetical protein
MGAALEQEKGDFGCMDWPKAAELGHIAGQLEEVEQFWTQSGEYEE